MSAYDKAKELKAQFGDNAKYVALEVKEEVKCFNMQYENRDNRLKFWSAVITLL